MSARRRLGAHLPAVFPERRQTVLTWFEVPIRLPVPASLRSAATSHPVAGFVADQWVVNKSSQRGGIDPLRLDRPLNLAVDEGAEPRFEQLERLVDPFVIGCRHVVRSLDRRALGAPACQALGVVAEPSEIVKEGKSFSFTVMVSALLLRSPAHPAPPSTDAVCSMSSAAGASNRRTICTTVPRPATARRVARRTSHTTRRLSAEPVAPPLVQAPKVSCSVPRPSGAGP